MCLCLLSCLPFAFCDSFTNCLRDFHLFTNCRDNKEVLNTGQFEPSFSFHGAKMTLKFLATRRQIDFLYVSKIKYSFQNVGKFAKLRALRRRSRSNSFDVRLLRRRLSALCSLCCQLSSTTAAITRSRPRSSNPPHRHNRSTKNVDVQLPES